MPKQPLSPPPGPSADAEDPLWRAALEDSLARVADAARRDAGRSSTGASGRHPALTWRRVAGAGLLATAVLLGLWAGMRPQAPDSGARPRLATAAATPADVPAAPGHAAALGPAPQPDLARVRPPSTLPGPEPGSAAAGQRLALVADPADAAGPALARTLVAALGDEAGLDPLPLPARGWSEMLERLDVDQPRLAVARYDALRLAQQSAPAPLSVLMPLFGHELQVLVRADSPLRHLHELHGLRINAGPGAGARRLSARTLYEAMFDAPLPPAPGDDLDEAAALQALLRGELDAVVLVAPQPAPPLAALPAAQARALRLLALDAQHPASRRALETFLPARLRPERFAPGLLDAPRPTLALMSFLVTGGRRTPQTDAALGRFAAALCQRLPLLARLDPAWAGVDPRRRLPTGWPTAAAAEAALHDCVPDPAAAYAAWPQDPPR